MLTRACPSLSDWKTLTLLCGHVGLFAVLCALGVSWPSCELQHISWGFPGPEVGRGPIRSLCGCMDFEKRVQILRWRYGNWAAYACF
jgi:hypothetical protein